MPGPAVHYIVGKKLSENYPFPIDYGNLNNKQSILFEEAIIRQLKDNPTYLNFGTLGPDFLFFNLKDWPTGVATPVKQMIKFAEFMKQIEDKVEESFPILIKLKELKDDLEEVAETVIESSPVLSAIKLMIDDIKAILSVISGIIKTALKDLVTSHVDLYGFVSSPIQICEEKEKWW